MLITYNHCTLYSVQYRSQYTCFALIFTCATITYSNCKMGTRAQGLEFALSIIFSSLFSSCLSLLKDRLEQNKQIALCTYRTMSDSLFMKERFALFKIMR